jgi:hypothetical protein
MVNDEHVSRNQNRSVYDGPGLRPIQASRDIENASVKESMQV